MRTWITRKSQIIGKSADEIKDLLSLPNNPTHVADIVFQETDTVFIREGIAAANKFGTGSGQQFEILSELNSDWFQNVRLLEDL